MQNPFTIDDIVLTKVKGKPVEATVVQTWKGEVQVKTATGDLLWRSMYTVWRAGEEPLRRERMTPAAATSLQNDATQPQETTRPSRRTKGAASKSKSRQRK